MPKQYYDPSSDQNIDQYDLYKQRLAAKDSYASEVANGGIKDESGPIGEGVGSEALATEKGGGGGANYGAAGVAAANTALSGGSPLDTAGTGLMMSGNPYAMAAGLGLKVVAAGEANKRAKQEQERQEYNARVQRRQEQLNRIANLGIE